MAACDNLLLPSLADREFGEGDDVVLHLNLLVQTDSVSD
jgi:hypothetical protein